MNVTNPAKRKFSCDVNEKGKMNICSEHESIVNFVFKPVIDFERTQEDNCVTINFTVLKTTKLIINFSYPDNFGGSYNCELTDVENDPDGKFSEPVPQLGILPQKRTYTFEV